jgi:hypothetical protein
MTPKRLTTLALVLMLALAVLAALDARPMTATIAGSPVDAPLLGLLYAALWIATILLAPPLLFAAAILTVAGRTTARCDPRGCLRRSVASPRCCR